MKTNRGYIYGCVLAVMIVLLMAANLVFGSVDIPVKAVANILFGGEVEKDSWQFIVWESRVPQCITALLCGTALSASGLMLQTVFSNPLADSSILGISSGASLGVALVLLAGGGSIIAGEFVLSGFLSFWNFLKNIFIRRSHCVSPFLYLAIIDYLHQLTNNFFVL